MKKAIPMATCLLLLLVIPYSLFEIASTQDSIHFDITYGSTTTTAGQRVQFTINCTGSTAPFTYQWYSRLWPTWKPGMPLHLDPIGAEVAWPNATSNVFDFIPPINGTYEVYVRVTDAENQTVCHPVGFGLWVYVLPSVESFAPLNQPTLLLLTPENVTYQTSEIPLNFTVDHPLAKINYSLDDQANNTINGNTTILSTPNGVHSLTLNVEDFAGMCTSATTQFTVDAEQVSALNPANQPSEPIAVWPLIAVVVLAAAIAGGLAFGVIKKREKPLNCGEA